MCHKENGDHKKADSKEKSENEKMFLFVFVFWLLARCQKKRNCGMVAGLKTKSSKSGDYSPQWQFVWPNEGPHGAHEWWAHMDRNTIHPKLKE
jgi:hypothetical protein